MYLSRIAIDKKRRTTCQALSIPEIMHAAVMGSFSSGEGALREQVRTLWRVDDLGDRTWLYVLSEHRPDFHHIADQFGRTGSSKTWETKDYQPLLDQIEDGQRWHFRLQANPVKALEGKRLPHVTIDQQKEWLKSRAGKNGFRFAQVAVAGETEDAFDIIHRDTIVFKKHPEDKARITLSVATFEGILEVNESEALRHALCFGIGKAKAYGCGLLTLAKP